MAFADVLFFAVAFAGVLFGAKAFAEAAFTGAVFFEAVFAGVAFTVAVFAREFFLTLPFKAVFFAATALAVFTGDSVFEPTFFTEALAFVAAALFEIEPDFFDAHFTADVAAFTRGALRVAEVF